MFERGVIILFYDTDLIFNFLYTDAITGLCLSSSCNICVSIFARTMRLIYCRLVLSSTHFICLDNDSRWKKILSLPLPFCENTRRNTDTFSFFQRCQCRQNKNKLSLYRKQKDLLTKVKLFLSTNKFSLLAANLAAKIKM